MNHAKKANCKEVDIWLDDPFIPASWATMMFFRRLGFPSDDVYLRYNKSDIFVGLHGDKYPEGASIRIGYHSHIESFISTWPYIMEAYQDGKIPDELLRKAWRSIPPFQSHEFALGLIQNIMSLGVTVPVFDPRAVEDGTLTPAAMKKLLAETKWN